MSLKQRVRQLEARSIEWRLSSSVRYTDEEYAAMDVHEMVQAIREMNSEPIGPGSRTKLKEAIKALKEMPREEVRARFEQFEAEVDAHGEQWAELKKRLRAQGIHSLAELRIRRRTSRGGSPN